MFELQSMVNNEQLKRIKHAQVLPREPCSLIQTGQLFSLSGNNLVHFGQKVTGRFYKSFMLQKVSYLNQKHPRKVSFKGPSGS